jgi:hypothetical protein
MKKLSWQKHGTNKDAIDLGINIERNLQTLAKNLLNNSLIHYLFSPKIEIVKFMEPNLV